MDASGKNRGRQESVEIVGSLALLQLPDLRPVGPHAGEARERAVSSSANQLPHCE
jgi:hypothetical protein